MGLEFSNSLSSVSFSLANHYLILWHLNDKTLCKLLWKLQIRNIPNELPTFSRSTSTQTDGSVLSPIAIANIDPVLVISCSAPKPSSLTFLDSVVLSYM